jgi:hypothetical protein
MRSVVSATVGAGKCSALPSRQVFASRVWASALLWSEGIAEGPSLSQLSEIALAPRRSR